MTEVCDLTAAFAVAEVRQETPLVDLGTPGARRHLGRGWSWDESTGDGMRFVWATGDSSVVELFFAAPRDLTATLRCFPFTFAGAPRQEVRVRLNQRPIASLVLAPGIREYPLALPAAALVAGTNTLTLDYAHSRRPSEVTGGNDDRALAVGWDFIRFDLDGPEEPAVDGRELFLPLASEVAYYLDLPARSRLELGALTLPPAGRLLVLWQVDGAPERQLAALRRSRGRWSAALPEGPGPVRIALRAVATDSRGSSREPVVVSAPAIRAERPTPPAAAADRPATGLSGEGPVNVLIYLVDALRADRLDCYGAAAGISPAIDELAAEGVVFERAIAQTSWTKPAVASVLTGLRPTRHGVNAPQDALAEEAVTLAERLQERGYRTAAFVTNGHVTAASGFAQGFEDFDFAAIGAREVTRKVLAWLAGPRPPEPFFLYVHTVDPHAAYEPEAEFRQRFAAAVTDPAVGTFDHIRALGDKKIRVTDELVADLRRLYDAEVAQNDHAFGLLLAGLRERQLEERTLIVLLSDHGDAFHEHGVFGHGWDLYNEVLAVPFVLRLPGGPAGERVGVPVEHVDVVPTVLDYLELPIPDRVQGRSLLPLVASRGAGRPDRSAGGPRNSLRSARLGSVLARSGRPIFSRPLFSYMRYEEREGISVVCGDWKLIEPLGERFAPGRELYDLRRDPEERRNLATQRPVLAGYLAALARGELRHLGAGLAQSAPVELDAETRRALEALGYGH